MTVQEFIDYLYIYRGRRQADGELTYTITLDDIDDLSNANRILTTTTISRWLNENT
jgi:hypothetical protein